MLLERVLWDLKMWNISKWLEKRKHCTDRRQTKHQSYCPVSLLPICSKIFERIIYNDMLKYFLDNNLISSKQSGFRPDSCINQLLSITHDIFTSFDNGLEVRGLFLDISKAFDKVWHDGFIYKLKQNEIKDKLLCLLIAYWKIANKE